MMSAAAVPMIWSAADVPVNVAISVLLPDSFGDRRRSRQRRIPLRQNALELGVAVCDRALHARHTLLVERNPVSAHAYVDRGAMDRPLDAKQLVLVAQVVAADVDADCW